MDLTYTDISLMDPQEMYISDSLRLLSRPKSSIAPVSFVLI